MHNRKNDYHWKSKQSITWEYTLERNLTSVHCVTEVSANPATCRHKHRVHSNRRPYYSPHCGNLELFKTNDDLTRIVFVFTLVQSRTHIDTVQNVLHGRHLLKSHNEGTVTINVPLTCVISHQLIYGEKPHKCHVCDDAFSHMRVHTGEKPYKCKLCDRSFSQSSHLQRHKRCVHSNRRPYHCPHSGKLFKTNTGLQRHVVFVFTLVQSGTHVNSVKNVLHGMINSGDICWSHVTMKVLGWRVTFVRRSSATVVALRHIYVDMKVWSRMFAVNVQIVSVQILNWNLISWHTRITNSFAVVYVVNIQTCT